MVAVTEWVWLGPVLALTVAWALPFVWSVLVFALAAVAVSWEVIRGAGRGMGLPVREGDSAFWRWVDGL